MSKNGKIECGNKDQKDIQWFKNYEKRSRTKHLENLKNKDILDYIKDIEQNCRLEVSSGDEDYAGTKRSSNCSVSNPDLTVHENSRKYLNTAAKKSTYRYLKPSSKGNSYKYRESSPRFYGSYSRMGHKMWPAVTEMTSLEVIKDSRSQDVIPKSRINGSRIIDRKSAKILQSRNTDRREFDFNLSTKGDLRHETVYDDFAFDRSETISDDVSRNDCGDKIELEELKPHVSFPDDSAYQAPHGESNKLTREYKLSNDLKNSREEAIETKMLRKKATRRYPSGKELSFETRRTPRKVASGNYSRLRHDAAESTCECKEPFHDPPAACLTGSCTCIGNNGNAERSDNDSPRRISTVYCCCSSSSLYDETDPVKKLESFCEKVKAVNQNVLRKTSRSAFSNAARTNAQRYSYGGSDEQNRSEISTTRVSRSIEREWLTDPTRLRLGKPKHSRGKTSLERILIYPPRGEVGPPLTLYKQSSNINCQVKGDVNTGFRYSVTYVQKFVSPSWMPSLSPQVLSSETDEECGCSADYG
ncbi:hypothetical protein RF55_6568 [Lasius niger]|uniref:Uncharacterized protein n=1 Tax=Lasius niger TaxID=67767 RepID=A0A0J7NLI5_LASNI|nr:hypothetical protein RF55_6568 [Lasius niger]